MTLPYVTQPSGNNGAKHNKKIYYENIILVTKNFVFWFNMLNDWHEF